MPTIKQDMDYENDVPQYPTGAIPRSLQAPSFSPNPFGFAPTVSCAEKSKHSHYYKDVSHLKTIDVYRVLDLFGVTDQALGHAIKKLLVAGGRGAGKDINKDIDEAIDTLVRRQEMQKENNV
jgi:hypothetical protein